MLFILLSTAGMGICGGAAEKFSFFHPPFLVLFWQVLLLLLVHSGKDIIYEHQNHLSEKFMYEIELC